MKIAKIASARLPTIYSTFQIIIYKSIKDKLEHSVLLKGKVSKRPTLVRVHSQCFTGDILSSLRCDCREQLVESLTKIGKARNGVLIYLNQEGRGIGLANKIKAYALQDKGYDTIEANKRLGFAPDARDYETAAAVLKDLNIQKIVLLSNNPDKARQLENYGIKVIKYISLEITPNKINKHYLKTKKDKLGHKLTLV